MSEDTARSLIQRFVNDPDFRARLESTEIAERRALIEQEGYGEVRLQHIAAVLPESAGGELSDEEFAAVAGGEITNTRPSDTALTLMSGATSAAAGAVVGLVL